ncbi:PDDEXK nuclease domain-containing protein [Chthonobacter rhizosphaerae]|uniref:PDDEXK nuclease domain-containing protein n=1 Tax=Chthonobacter rhizosphaerae TaxID=2735553 RepID=UPI0015EFC3A2|nr:PDDEXK nuclease domain-containing protein [Chthonobacter rhizosphaerae]
MPSNPVPPEYGDWLSDLKDAIRQARTRAVLAINAEMSFIYWRIGRDILDRQRDLGWGARVIDRLSVDLKEAFPDAKGFSPRNLKYMRRFAEVWPDRTIVQGILARLPWSVNIALLDKLEAPDARLWYAQAANAHGWTRDVLVHQIETRLHERQGRATENFVSTLEPGQAIAAAGLFKDPYILDFVDLAAEGRERDLEAALVNRIRNLLLELGTGFAFLGSQYRLTVAGRDYYLDLLFYHTKLHCHVVVDLKIGEFEPEFIGKMGFYLAAVDDHLMTEGDRPSIGLILCRSKTGLVVEYALRHVSKPIAVSAYTVLPSDIARVLPSPTDLEAGLDTGP